MSGPGPDDVVVPQLMEIIRTALDDARDSGLVFTVGQGMGALFTVFVEAAQGSPEYDPKRLVEEVDAKIREATGLQ